MTFQITEDDVAKIMEEVSYDVILFSYANERGSVTMKHRPYGDGYVIFINGEEIWDYANSKYAVVEFNETVRSLS